MFENTLYKLTLTAGINTSRQRLFKEQVKVQTVIVFVITNLKVEYGLFVYSYKGKSFYEIHYITELDLQ